MIFQVFGQVQNPLCQVNDRCYGDLTGMGGSGGLAYFIGNVIRFITIAGGVYALFNFVTAGIDYINSKGDPKGIETAKNKIVMSIIGLAIIAISYVLIAVLGQVLFGDYGIFIRITIQGLS